MGDPLHPSQVPSRPDVDKMLTPDPLFKGYSLHEVLTALPDKLKGVMQMSIDHTSVAFIHNELHGACIEGRYFHSVMMLNGPAFLFKGEPPKA